MTWNYYFLVKIAIFYYRYIDPSFGADEDLIILDFLTQEYIFTFWSAKVYTARESVFLFCEIFKNTFTFDICSMVPVNYGGDNYIYLNPGILEVDYTTSSDVYYSIWYYEWFRYDIRGITGGFIEPVYGLQGALFGFRDCLELFWTRPTYDPYDQYIRDLPPFQFTFTLIMKCVVLYFFFTTKFFLYQIF